MNPYRILIKPEARNDIARAAGWYDSQEIGLRVRFLDAIEKTLHRLQSNPFLYQAVYQNIYRAPVDRFPYGLGYVIEGSRVSILACFHAKQDPQHWQNINP